MGASESSLTSSQTKPILTSAPAESSLTDILVRKSFSSSTSGTVNPNVLLELLSVYREWQEEKAQRIKTLNQIWDYLDGHFLACKLFIRTVTATLKSVGKTKWFVEEIENKIEVADALAVKLLQRFNYSVSAIKTTSDHLSEVHALQVELGELKGRLTEVISNCDALCKRIASEGPRSLQSSVELSAGPHAKQPDHTAPSLYLSAIPLIPKTGAFRMINYYLLHFWTG
ncbi:hypothetical protein PHJA_000957900 [Phtheirospermum japonicum]|uniref:Uncharacterized protein n=1 Tax=Phtheirospermum japonicum TaxID=374723 RepID=A0A830BQ02_9LAMI|nr:hypothetical protein PHJA_000957900 [Phtheirospermum japonicum]